MKNSTEHKKKEIREIKVLQTWQTARSICYKWMVKTNLENGMSIKILVFGFLDNEAEWIEIWFSYCSSSYIADWNVMLSIVMLFVLDDSTFTKYSTRSVFTVILWLIDLLTLYNILYYIVQYFTISSLLENLQKCALIKSHDNLWELKYDF
jgi:hypothetical protein